MLDPAALAIACLPLGAYLIVLGFINLRHRALVVSGTVDAAALAAVVGGLAIVGPMNLFLPEAAVVRFGGLVWVLLLSFYGLCVLLYLLVARRRIVIYNISAERLRPLVELIARRLDADARISGDAVHMPQLNVQFYLESTAVFHNTMLVATGEHQSHSHWKRLEKELATALGEVDVAPNRRGFTLLAVGLLLVGGPLVVMLRTPVNVVAESFREILRL